MTDPAKKLRELKPTKEFFIGIDSDGCVFDTMEIKQKECFCPQFINHMGLQPASKYARETWEFVNLYSTTRGVNRFPALIRALDLLGERGDVKARKVDIPRMDGVRSWIKRETKLGNPVLKAEAERSHDPDLEKALEWSVDVNESVKKIVRNVPPFPYVKESLQAIKEISDSIVVSQTPCNALVREWDEHGIARYVREIAGQEMGKKSEHLSLAAKGKYPREKMLMIGDAPGDLESALDNGISFFPIIPGREEVSWRIFLEEALEKFLSGKYSGEYEKSLISEFNKCLPEIPPWRGA